MQLLATRAGGAGGRPVAGLLCASLAAELTVLLVVRLWERLVGAGAQQKKVDLARCQSDLFGYRLIETLNSRWALSG